MSLVLPGTEIPLDPSSSTTFGPGIGASSSRANPFADPSISPPVFAATRAGLLNAAKARDGKRQWVEGVSKRYIPAARDIVLGTIIARHADGYRVDVGSAQMASLDALAFESATKRSKPNLKVSYGLAVRAVEDLQEVVCSGQNNCAV